MRGAQQVESAEPPARGCAYLDDQAWMISYWPSARTTWTKSPSVSAVCGVKANSARQVPSVLA
jgi:hypothetical protein